MQTPPLGQLEVLSSLDQVPWLWMNGRGGMLNRKQLAHRMVIIKGPIWNFFFVSFSHAHRSAWLELKICK
ncbi:hypothetical protein L916_14838 [Phytophthora nicotianae]|uniref:Uncharacterized protein n=1 Tax=Phytophthora nicotianae TaxID=4792 RepID=W2IEN8_PHYNI|nr:hypothetical protein L916_14838 [Phytophthora nicotianae]